MFNQQQKPAFKFLIRSKLENKDSSETDKQTESESTPVLNTIKTDTLEERKRKRTEKDSVPPIAAKKIHHQLEKWNRKKEELKQERQVEEEIEQARHDYLDLVGLTCILCQRKFKSRPDLEKHQAISELHKKNLNDTAVVNKAKLKISFMKSEQDLQMKIAEQPSSEYRNRAAERRQAYGQPEKPVMSPSPPLASRQLPVPNEIEALPKASMHVPISDNNKGARMLLQMGWKKGEGLGKHGTGILDPIKAESYAQSAGVGASTATTAGKSYQSRTLEMVSCFPVFISCFFFSLYFYFEI
ncbi:hypothetical protein BD560DRAFT_410929 [Blakeslea trispora]|nr:hypothetical protein BD560DRAFT_410929 [Blakeslea trispora]